MENINTTPEIPIQPIETPVTPTPNLESPKSNLFKYLFIFFITLSLLIIFSQKIITKQQTNSTNFQSEKTQEDKPNLNIDKTVVSPTKNPISQPTPEIKKLNDNFYFFTNKDLGLSFEFPLSWGNPEFMFDGDKYLIAIFFPSVGPNSIVFSATNPTAKSPGRGAFWGDYVFYKYIFDSKDDCISSGECKEYQNKNSISILKKTYSVYYEGGEEEDPVPPKTNQYYIYNPNSIYSSIAISDERFDNTKFPNAVKEVENLINSLKFIK